MSKKTYHTVNDVDVSENWIKSRYPEALEQLLRDHTTCGNIYWATDSYEGLGEGYMTDDEITVERITSRDNEKLLDENMSDEKPFDTGKVIQPRVVKSREVQDKRVKAKAEVFTPTWVCNAQNNLIDEAWFGRKDVFNREYIDEQGRHCWEPTRGKIQFSEEPGKTWMDYVRDIRMEITCGEAPYLVSRYDATTGEPITDLDMRIGLLDRKLRVINENACCMDEWLELVHMAYKSTYGYEWLGDNLLIARENLLFTFIDYYRATHNNQFPKKNSVKLMAYIISWNLWQMDGIKLGLPGHDPKGVYRKCKVVQATPSRADLPTEEELFTPEEQCIKPAEVIEVAPRDSYCVIKDWELEQRLKKYVKKNKAIRKRIEEEQEYIIPFVNFVNSSKNQKPTK